MKTPNNSIIDTSKMSTGQRAALETAEAAREIDEQDPAGDRGLRRVPTRCSDLRWHVGGLAGQIPHRVGEAVATVECRGTRTGDDEARRNSRDPTDIDCSPHTILPVARRRIEAWARSRYRSTHLAQRQVLRYIQPRTDVRIFFTR